MYETRNIHLMATQCVENCQAPPTDDDRVFDDEGTVSDPGDADATLTITADQDYVLDDNLEVGHLIIEGRLTFAAGSDITLTAKSIQVRDGEFAIGSLDEPYTGNAQIVLKGQSTDDSVGFNEDFLIGQNAIVNYGKVTFYGQTRQKMTRLLSAATKGSSSITVGEELDYEEGDKVVIMSTSYSQVAYDGLIVDSYDSETGKLTFTSSLRYYHFGDSESTATDLGVDIRAEVIQMKRNIVITHDRDVTDAIGCQIVTADFEEAAETEEDPPIQHAG